MLKGKASRPDGFPSEFYQEHWEMIKEDLLWVCYSFQDNKLDLWRINKAQISLVPKSKEARKIIDYRPINIIDGPIKIIFKILAKRLQLRMPELVSEEQTTFIKNMHIIVFFGD